MRTGWKKRRATAALSECVVEKLESRQLLAGVTVITHGWQADTSRPTWLDSMATEIEARVGEALPVYVLRIERSLAWSVQLWNAPGPTDLEHAASGEAILLLDWAAASGTGWVDPYYTTTTIASIATDVLTHAYPTIGITHPLAELPIHLMGHSRGGSVVSEMSRLLGQAGVVVDQQTTWDPHPVSPDPVAVVYTNTLFADNYYQTDNWNLSELFLTGSIVQGAHNVLLNGMSIGHGGVHDWYYRTIPASPHPWDTSSWYSFSDTGPRSEVAFAWSRIGKGDRPDDGAITGAYRTPVTPTGTGSALWDNVLIGGWVDDIAVQQGTHTPVVIGAIPWSGSSTVFLGLDDDANPYDGGITWVTGKPAAEITSGVWQTEIDTSSLTPNTYYHIVAAIGNGTHVRYDYSLGTLGVTVSSPTDIMLDAASVAENRATGTAVGALSVSDPDPGDRAVYSLVSGAGSTDNSNFTISGDQLLAASGFDYETKDSYSIRVRATDSWGLSFEKVFTIHVTDINESPTDITLFSSSITENLPAGTVVSTLSTADPDSGNTLTYSLVTGTGSIDNASFTISASQLLATTSFNYETKNSYTIRIRATDQGGLWFEKAFTIAVTNANETPTDVSLSNASVAENQTAGTVMGTFNTADPDAGDTFTYTLVGGSGSTDNGLFAISGGTLQIAALVNYEAKSSYSIRVRSTDQRGLYTEKVFAITVTDVNEAPTDIALSGTSLPEVQPIGTLIGTLSGIDPDAGQSAALTFSLVPSSDDNAFFTIDVATKQLRTAGILDYERRSSYSIRIRTTDAGGLSYEKAFTISVVDLPEFGMQQGKVTRLAFQGHDGDMLTFSLTGGGSGVMQLDGTLNLTNTTAKSVLTISVKKGKYGGDGLVGIGGITSDGLLKSINASAAVLLGQVRVNTLNQSVGKATVSMKFRQMSNAGIQVQGLPVSSIAVSGDVSGSRIATTGSIAKFSAATLLDSDILVGVATSFAGDFASGTGDFANTTARLGSLTVSGRKLPSGSSHPVYVAGSHISSPTVGTVTLLNVPAGSGAIVHVMADTGVLKVSRSRLVGEPMMASGTWKTGSHPVIWEVV